MSGHKRATISIPEDEYRRLHEAEMRNRYMQADIPGLIERASQQTQANLNQYYVEFERRQVDFVDALQEVDADLASLEARTSQAMLQHQSVIQDHLSEIAGSLWEQAGNMIAEVEQHYQEDILAVQQSNNDALTAFSQQMEQGYARERERQRAAQHWIRTAQSVAVFIAQQYDHENFMPGSLRSWDRRLMHAQQNLYAGMPEAAVALAQDAYVGLSDLRVQLEKLQTEHHALLQAAQEYLLRLEHEAHASLEVQAMDLLGNALPSRIEVNFWSGGRLLRLTQEIEKLRAELAGRDSRSTSDYLEHLITTQLPEMQQRLMETVFQARLAVLSSQLRLNIADRVLSALDSQGYSLQDGYYEGDDNRETYTAVLCALDGGEILVRVNPITDQAPQNELHLIAQDYEEKTQHEMRQRALEVQRALLQSGLEVGRLVQVADREQNAKYAGVQPVKLARKRPPVIVDA